MIDGKTSRQCMIITPLKFPKFILEYIFRSDQENAIYTLTH